MGTASVSAVRPTWPCKELVTERACQQQRAPVDYHKHANAGQLEERKLREIAHSRVGRSILQGYERDSDTNPAEEPPNIKYYSVAQSSEEYFFEWLRQRCKGVKALDYCCGSGKNGIFMAKCGADVIGIDISPDGIEKVRLNARQEGVTPNCIFRVMDGEAMDFQDNTFDLIVESGALHHLDFQRAVSELRRVVKPSGEILCIEALRHNPFIHLYRMKTMYLRTQWDVEHILGVEHLDMARNYFGEVSVKFFHLFVLAAVPFRKTRIFTPLRQFLTRVDETILRKPIIGKYAWIMIFTLSKPKKV